MNSGLTGALGTAPLQTVKVRLGSFQGRSYSYVPIPKNGGIILGAKHSTFLDRIGADSCTIGGTGERPIARATGTASFAGGGDVFYVSVASGAQSFAYGGSTASGSGSFAVGGFGWGNNASGTGSIVLGAACGASSNTALAIGFRSSATANGAIALGEGTLANRRGIICHSSGVFDGGSNEGRVQAIVSWTGGAKTTNTTPQIFYPRRAENNPFFSIPSGRVCSFLVRILGVKSNGLSIAEYWRKVRIKNVDGTTSLVGDIESVGTDYGDVTLTSIDISANDANDSLQISVQQSQDSFAATGVASTDVITAVGHNFADGQNVVFISLTGGSGLNTTTNYYVRDVAGDTFKLSTSIGGGAVNFTTDITAATIGEVWRWLAALSGGEVLYGGV